MRRRAAFTVACLVATSLPNQAFASPAASADGPIHSDGIGSIRRLTDESGQVTDTYTYTAFGELITHTGSDPQPYAFAGEPYDPNSGFQYHRARWMDPSEGRFGTIDPFKGWPEVPKTIHSYAYAAADPVNDTDPTGRASNLIWGRQVHAVIGAHFEFSKPGARVSDRSLTEIFFRLYGDPDAVDYIGLLRPDLVDLQTKEVFEIKLAGSTYKGYHQLEGYLWALNWADPDKTKPWTPGLNSSYTPPRTIPVAFG